MFRDSEDHELLRRAVAGLAADYGHDYWAGAARSGRRTDELWKALSSGGFVGVNLPEEHGGAGLGIVELAIVCEELAAAGCPILLLVISSAISGSILAAHGTPEQQETWMPRMATGDAKIAFAITEPDAGSNSHRLATTARRSADGWVLAGAKHYISIVDEAAAILVVARTGTDEATGRGRLSLFLVDADAPGISATHIPVEATMPERQFALFLDDVRVPADRLVGREGEGLRLAFAGLNPERITTAATAVGIGRYALDKAAAYANQRIVWEGPIGSHQGIAHPLAEAKIALDLAGLATRRAGWEHDAGRDAAESANVAKFAAAEAALQCLDRAIQTHGGNGMATEFGLADLWGVARLLRTIPVSREMILNYVAQHSLGLPRSY